MKHVNTSTTDKTGTPHRGTTLYHNTLGYRMSQAAGDYTAEIIEAVCDWYINGTYRPGYEAAISEVMHLIGMMHQVTLAEVREIIKYKLKDLEEVKDE